MIPIEQRLSRSPFASYVVPRLAQLAVGSANLAGAVGVLRRRRRGAPLSLAACLMWVGWFVVQVAVVGLVGWQQPVYLVDATLTDHSNGLPEVPGMEIEPRPPDFVPAPYDLWDPTAVSKSWNLPAKNDRAQG